MAGHLAAQGRKLLADLVIDQMMQSDPIPTAVVLDERDDRIAGIRKESRQTRKRVSLLRRGQELERSSPFHFAIFSSIRMGVKHPFLPALKGGVSWTIR